MYLNNIIYIGRYEGSTRNRNGTKLIYFSVQRTKNYDRHFQTKNSHKHTWTVRGQYLLFIT